jgi:hypothetical protein
VTEPDLVAPPPPELLRRALRAALGRLGRPLRVLAEDVGGIAGPIDLVTTDPAGRVVAVLVDLDPASGLSLVGRGLAEHADLEPRIRDWRKLAPELALAADCGVDCMLVASDFAPAVLAAAAAAGPRLDLVRIRFLAEPAAAGPRALLERPGQEPEVRVAPPREPPSPLRAVFRTGLSESDLVARG